MHAQTLIRSSAAAVAALHPYEAARVSATRMLQSADAANRADAQVMAVPCGLVGAMVDGYQHVLQMNPSPLSVPHLPDGTPRVGEIQAPVLIPSGTSCPRVAP